MDGIQRCCSEHLLASQMTSHHPRHPWGLAETTRDLEGTSLEWELAAQEDITVYLNWDKTPVFRQLTWI